MKVFRMVPPAFFLLLSLAAFSIVCQGLAEPASTDNGSSRGDSFQNCFFSRLAGSRVENQDGQRVGRLKDCLLDLVNGKVECSIVTGGGLFGWGRRSSLLPADSLTTATAKKGVLGLTIPRQQWLAAPILHSGDLPELTREHLRMRASNVRTNRRATATGPDSISPTERANARPHRTRVNLQLATDLLGRPVLNRQETRLGEVSDLILDLNDGKPAFAVLSRHSFLRKPEKYVVPLTALSEDISGRLIVELREAQFANAPAFTDPAWRETMGASGGLVFRLSSRERAELHPAHPRPTSST